MSPRMLPRASAASRSSETSNTVLTAVEIIEKVAASTITSCLVEAGYEKNKAESYGEAMQKGGALIVAEAPDDKADEALDMMRPSRPR